MCERSDSEEEKEEAAAFAWGGCFGSFVESSCAGQRCWFSAGDADEPLSLVARLGRLAGDSDLLRSWHVDALGRRMFIIGSLCNGLGLWCLISSGNALGMCWKWGCARGSGKAT